MWVFRSGSELGVVCGGGGSATLGCPLEEYASGTSLLGVLASGTTSIGADGQTQQVGAG